MSGNSRDDLSDLGIPRLGVTRVASPLEGARFISDEARVLASTDPEVVRGWMEDGLGLPAFEAAGPRERIYFQPGDLTAAIVSCGGLCPGINDVIRALVMQLWYRYGVRRILGVQYGYRGLKRGADPAPMALTPEAVAHTHEFGGSFLSSSRGEVPPGEMVDELVRLGIGLLFTIGGDGTLRGARVLVEEIRSRGLPIGVVGLPKTIDNDISHIERSFGFETAVSMGTQAVLAAHAEARGAPNGIGLVKLMGRHSGFVACHVVLARAEVNLVLVPEVPFRLEGPGGVLEFVERRVLDRRHAVIVVAEGAGQALLRQTLGEPGKDASGNTRLHDIGTYLRDRISLHFKERGIELNMKYIDPSYMIRAARTTSDDSAFCHLLAQEAVHAGMSGRTGLVVGLVHGSFVHIPVGLTTAGRQRVDPLGSLWQSVRDATGQPAWFGGEAA